MILFKGQLFENKILIIRKIYGSTVLSNCQIITFEALVRMCDQSSNSQSIILPLYREREK